MAVLFPVLSAQSGDADKQQYTYSATIRMLMISMFPICFTAVVLAKPLLTFWLGAEFAEKSTLVLQLLAVGVFANTMAQAPANLIQSSGNPKWMALLHLIELPIFVGMLYMMTTKYGIVGTAACWAGRMVVDAVILYALANHYISSPSLGASWYFVALVCCTVLFVGFWQHSVVISGVFWLSGVTFFVLVAWYILLHSLDRLAIQSLINRLSRGESEFF